MIISKRKAEERGINGTPSQPKKADQKGTPKSAGNTERTGKKKLSYSTVDNNTEEEMSIDV